MIINDSFYRCLEATLSQLKQPLILNNDQNKQRQINKRAAANNFLVMLPRAVTRWQQ